MNPTDLRPKLFFGWYIVGAGVVISLYTAGVIGFGFTAAFEPIVREFGWSYTQISLAASLRALEVGAIAPVIGWAVDRWGARRLIMIGSIMSGTGLIFLSRIHSLWMFYLAFFIAAIGASTNTSTVMMMVISKWFKKKATLAMGIIASGVALGGLLIPLVTWMIDHLGWRTAMVAMGLGMWLIPLPLSAIIRNKPAPYGYRPDGELPENSTVGLASTGLERAKAVVGIIPVTSSRPFWIISITFLFHVLSTNAVVTHIMPYLSSIGFSRSKSSVITTALPLLTILGRLGLGWIGDRIDKRWGALVSFGLTAVGLLAFAFVVPQNNLVLCFFLICYGIGWGGAVPMMAALLLHYYGISRFGTILGMAGGIMSVGMLTGAPLAGWVYDVSGSYQWVWYALAAVVALAALFLSLLPPTHQNAKRASSPLQDDTLRAS